MKKLCLLMISVFVTVFVSSCLNEEPFTETVVSEEYLVNNGGTVANNILSQNITVRKPVVIKDLDLNGHTLTVAADGVTLDGVTNGNVVLEGADRINEISSRSAARAANGNGNGFGLIKEKSVTIKDCDLDTVDVKEQKWTLNPAGQVKLNILNFFESRGEIAKLDDRDIEAKLDINVLGIKKDAQGTVIGAGNIKATKFDTFETQVTVGDSVVNVTISNKIVISANGVKIDSIIKVTDSGKGKEIEGSDGVIINLDQNVDKENVVLPQDVDKNALVKVDTEEFKEPDLNLSAVCPDKTYSWVFNDLSLSKLDAVMDPQPGKEKLYKYETGTLYYTDVFEEYHYDSIPSGMDLIFGKGTYHAIATTSNESRHLRNVQVSKGVLIPGNNEFTYMDIKGPFKVKMFYAAKTNTALNKHDVEGLYAYIRIGSNYFYDKYKESKICPGDGSVIEAVYGGNDVVRVYFGSKSEYLNNRVGIWDIKVTQANPGVSDNNIECKMSEAVAELDEIDTYRFSEINLKITDNDEFVTDIDESGEKIYNTTISSASAVVKRLAKISGVSVNLDLSECKNLTTIFSTAFGNLSCLSSVKLADTTNVMAGAFKSSSNIKKFEVVVKEKDEEKGIDAKISSLNGVLFNSDKSNLIVYPASASATTYTVPSTVKTIEKFAFAESEKLTSVRLNEGLINIRDQAFLSCFNLASLELPASLEDAEGPFNGCSSLNLTVKASNQNLKIVDGVLFTKDGKKLIWYQQNKDGADYTVPEEVEVIGKSAFYMSKLQAVYFEGSGRITSFPESTIGMAKNLMRMDIPEGITSIGEYAFHSTSKLCAIWLPSTIESISWRAFSKDSELKKVYFKGTRAELDAIMPTLITEKPENTSQSDYDSQSQFIRNATYICSDEAGYQKPPVKLTPPDPAAYFSSWMFDTCPAGLESVFYTVKSSSEDKNYGESKAVSLKPEFGTDTLKVYSLATTVQNGIRWDESLHTINSNRNEDTVEGTSDPDVTKNAARFVLNVSQPCTLEVVSIGAGNSNTHQRRMVVFSVTEDGNVDQQLAFMNEIDQSVEFKMVCDLPAAGTYYLDCNAVRTSLIALKKPE